MKKLLILILICLVLTLTIFTVVKGVELGGLSILGINLIQDKNVELDKKIEEATKLVTITYPKKINDINFNVKKLEEAKKSYEDMASLSTSDEVTAATQILNYKIEVLWTKIGIHAKKDGVKINIAVVNGTGGSDNYNLNFTVNGSYVNISEFIRDIEDDSTIGFKIEEFSLKSGNSDTELQGTFVCKNITIKDISQTTSSNNTDTATEENNINTTNNSITSNTTNMTNTSNTLDTTNTMT